MFLLCERKPKTLVEALVNTGRTYQTHAIVPLGWIPVLTLFASYNQLLLFITHIYENSIHNKNIYNIGATHLLPSQQWFSNDDWVFPVPSCWSCRVATATDVHKWLRAQWPIYSGIQCDILVCILLYYLWFLNCDFDPYSDPDLNLVPVFFLRLSLWFVASWLLSKWQTLTWSFTWPLLLLHTLLDVYLPPNVYSGDHLLALFMAL